MLTVLNQKPHINDESSLSRYFPPAEIDSLANEAIAEYIEELYAIYISDHDVKRDLYSLISSTFKWVLLATRSSTISLAKTLSIHANHHHLDFNPVIDKTLDTKLDKVLAVEDTIHSPILGIKGQVDLISNGKLMQLSNQDKIVVGSDVAVPIEFKTGKWRASTSVGHRAQVILYIMLMNLRDKSFAFNRKGQQPLMRSANQASENDKNVNLLTKYGVLLYINNNEDVKVDLIWPLWLEIRALMISRNSLAKSLRNSITAPYESQTTLPPMIRSTYECSYCYSATECMIYHTAIENGDEQTSGLPELYQFIMKGITAKRLEYFKTWDKLIDLEYLATEGNMADIWSTLSIHRERKGNKAISLLSLASPFSSKEDSSEIELTFERMSSIDCLLAAVPSSNIVRSGTSASLPASSSSSSFLSSAMIGHHCSSSNNIVAGPLQQSNSFHRSSSSPAIASTSAQSSSLEDVYKSLVLRDMTLSQITPGDRVLISIEKSEKWFNYYSNLFYSTSSGSSGSTSSSSSGLAQGAGLFNEASKSLMSVNANICSGSVISIDAKKVVVKLTAGNKAITR